MPFYIIFLIVLTLTNSWAKTWDLNDATYIFKLESAEKLKNTLSLKQDHIPLEWFKKELASPDGRSLRLTPFTSSNYLEYESWNQEQLEDFTVVAFRIDACFKDLFSDKCRKQVRVVWQPVVKSSFPWKSEEVTTIDAAIHTFYDLSDSEFDTLARQLLHIKKRHRIKTSGMPLSVHPGFQKPAYVKDLASTLKTVIFPSKITRIAFFKLDAEKTFWDFMSFDVQGGKLIAIKPIGIQETVQTIERGVMINNTADPSPDQLFATTVMDQFRGQSESQGIAKIKRIKNPRFHLPGTIDCFSCHATHEASATTALPAKESLLSSEELQLNGSYNLKNGSDLKEGSEGRIFRALGYMNDKLVISDRVIYETAIVSDMLNEMNLNH